jgi:hypothetical protein
VRPDVAKQEEGPLDLKRGQVGAEEEALLLELGAQLSAMVGRPRNSEREQEGDAGIQAADGILVHVVVASGRGGIGGRLSWPLLTTAVF